MSSRWSRATAASLVRAGHTEAAVDVARLAGLNPSGVICEIMKDDGTMARLDDLVAFAQLHNLKIGTIRDLIAYRRRYDHLVEKARRDARSRAEWGGDVDARMTFRNKAHRQRAGRAGQGQDRSGQADAGAHAPVSPFRPTCSARGERARRAAAPLDGDHRRGEARAWSSVINQPRPDQFSRAPGPRRQAARPRTWTSCAITASARTILTELGVQDMVLLTNTHHTLIALDGYGLSIVGERPIRCRRID